nr:hypothetical protein [Tanacetum cinerariifolium]
FWLFTCGVEGRVTKLEDNDQEKMDKMERMEKRLETIKTNYALVLSNKDRLDIVFYHMHVSVSERLGWYARPYDSIDVLTTFGESQPPKPQGPPSGSQENDDTYEGPPTLNVLTGGGISWVPLATIGATSKSDEDSDNGGGFTCGVEGRVTKLEDNDQEKMDKMERMEKRLETIKTNYALVLSNKDRLDIVFYHMQVSVSERLGWYARPYDSIDVLTTFGESQPPKPQGPPSCSQ